MKLHFNDKVYDSLTWPYAQEVATTINAVVAFVGALIGISTASYNKANGAGK